MSAAKLTPWFKGDVKPVRKGVYQREYGAGSHHDIRFNYWDGLRWRWPSGNPQAAHSNWRHTPTSTVQNLRWRGLASDPNGAAA